ncbi:MAG: hypothetical protein ACR2M6_00810 [Vampirovibrionia bacterium]
MTTVFIIILIILVVLINCDLDYREKVQKSAEDGYGVTLSLLPDFKSKNDYKKYFQLIDEMSKINGAKISVKIRQLGENRDSQLRNFLDIVQYANQNNVFVWISTTVEDDEDDEMIFYEHARGSGFRNIGITLATNKPDINDSVDNVLRKGGHIRLVKGYYKTSMTNQWNQVGEVFKINAEKLLESHRYHVIATHDFDILTDLYRRYKGSRGWKTIEFGFFYSSLNYVQYMIKKRAIDFPTKSVYIPYGPFFNYFFDNISMIDLKHIIERKISSLYYIIF